MNPAFFQLNLIWGKNARVLITALYSHDIIPLALAMVMNNFRKMYNHKLVYSIVVSYHVITCTS